MRTTQVYNQVTWPGAGDPDDCWVVAALQAANVTSPWLWLPTVPRFRKAAGNPDDPNRPDGGNLIQAERGLLGCYPFLAGLVHRHPAWTWSHFRQAVESGHPASVSIVSAVLPASLRFGFGGRHQIALAWKDGQLLYANPLARDRSRWLRITWGNVKPAILAYGKLRTGSDCVYALTLPTDKEARTKLMPALADTTPYDQGDLDAATAELQARIDAAQAALDGPAGGS